MLFRKSAGAHESKGVELLLVAKERKERTKSAQRRRLMAARMNRFRDCLDSEENG
jgi:hypothetical protein